MPDTVTDAEFVGVSMVYISFCAFCQLTDFGTRCYTLISSGNGIRCPYLERRRVMATSTFDRRIEIKSPEAIRNLAAIIASDPPKEPISKHPYGQAERERSDALLKQWLSL